VAPLSVRFVATVVVPAGTFPARESVIVPPASSGVVVEVPIACRVSSTRTGPAAVKPSPTSP